jgi:hypothetical protein
MANLRVTLALRNARLDGLKTAIDAGAGPGLIKIYSGTQPANADAALSGNTLIGTLTFTDPSAPAASGGVLTFSPIAQDVSADQTLVATWARITDSTGAQVFDCDVAQSGATINLNTVSIVTGGPIQISSFTITDPAT